MKKFYKEVLKECREVEQEILQKSKIDIFIKSYSWITILITGIVGIIIGTIIGKILL